MQNRSRSSSAASLNRTQARTVCVPRPRPTRCGPTRQGWYKRPPPLPFSPKPQAFSHLQLPCAATRSICRHARAPLCALPSPLRRPHLHQKLRGKQFKGFGDQAFEEYEQQEQGQEDQANLEEYLTTLRSSRRTVLQSAACGVVIVFGVPLRNN
uniref:Uncharacterized protein n=1 Tax=Setaria viridis TaxID=4556 RepID=A0A4U6TJH5_SETVI|nr:hypothetical protein SEVIR_8G252228v2 [Setaria viridis]